MVCITHHVVIWVSLLLCLIGGSQGWFWSSSPAKPAFWDASRIPKATNGKDTRLIDTHTVKRDHGGEVYLVRSVESTTPKNGTMTWRVELEGTALFRLGVVSASYTGVQRRHERVWMTDGDGVQWDYGISKAVNINNEDTESPTHTFQGGDIVQAKYDPVKQLLTFQLEKKPGWRTTRRLEGEGLDEVHFCACIWGTDGSGIIRILGQERKYTAATLHWDEAFIAHRGNKDTWLIDAHTVQRRDLNGRAELVRSVESITLASGTMTWRLALEAGKCFYLGIMSAKYTDGNFNNERVWVAEGDGDGWLIGFSTKRNLNNERTKAPSHLFQRGDVVVVTYDPAQRLLSFELDAKPGWRTVRRLEGAGLDEVHPCAYIWQGMTEPFGAVRVLSRNGTSRQEYENKQLPEAMQEISRLREQMQHLQRQFEGEIEGIRKGQKMFEVTQQKKLDEMKKELESAHRHCNTTVRHLTTMMEHTTATLHTQNATTHEIVAGIEKQAKAQQQTAIAACKRFARAHGMGITFCQQFQAKDRPTNPDVGSVRCPTRECSVEPGKKKSHSAPHKN